MRKRTLWAAGVCVVLLVAIVGGVITAKQMGGSRVVADNEPLKPCTFDEARSRVDWPVVFPTRVLAGAMPGAVHVDPAEPSQKVWAEWALPKGSIIHFVQMRPDLDVGDGGDPRAITVKGVPAKLYRYVRDDGAILVDIVWRSDGVSHILSGVFLDNSELNEAGLIDMAESCQ